MALDDLAEVADGQSKTARDRLIAVYIGVLAVGLAICALGGNNAAKEATLKNIEAANTWAFFQAKNMRRQVLRLQVDDLELQLLGTAGNDTTLRPAIEAKIQSYKDLDKQLTSDKKSGEGLDELFVKGKALETERDTAMSRDPYFDLGEAALQIAIVVASVAIISGAMFLLAASFGLGLVGALMTFNGYFLYWQLPFVS